MQRIAQITTVLLAALVTTATVAQERRDDAPAVGSDVRARSDLPPRGGPDSAGQPDAGRGPMGPRRPGDVRGRGGPMPLGELPGRGGPLPPGIEPGRDMRGSGRRPGGPDGVGGMRGGPRGPGLGPGPIEMQRLAQDDPEMHELLAQDNRLEREATALARRIRQAKSPEREKLESELAVIVNKHFDVRQQRRELSLARMEEELRRLREAIDDRAQQRSDIVQKRIAELVGSDSSLEF